MKYHINKHGVPAICRATEGNCPLGGEGDHFDNIISAQRHADSLNSERYGTLPTTSLSMKTEDGNVIKEGDKVYVVEDYYGEEFMYSDYDEAYEHANEGPGDDGDFYERYSHAVGADDEVEPKEIEVNSAMVAHLNKDNLRQNDFTTTDNKGNEYSVPSEVNELFNKQPINRENVADVLDESLADGAYKFKYEKDDNNYIDATISKIGDGRYAIKGEFVEINDRGGRTHSDTGYIEMTARDIDMKMPGRDIEFSELLDNTYEHTRVESGVQKGTMARYKTDDGEDIKLGDTIYTFEDSSGEEAVFSNYEEAEHYANSVSDDADFYERYEHAVGMNDHIEPDEVVVDKELIRKMNE